MKIFNRSRLSIDRALWHRVAIELGLDGPIRDAELVDRNGLTVVIQPDVPREGAVGKIYGEYSLGRINIFPCRACTPGALTLTFLHEVAHAWLYEHHEERYFSDWSEEFCEEYAIRRFGECGGSVESEGCIGIVLGIPAVEHSEISSRLIEECFRSFCE